MTGSPEVSGEALAKAVKAVEDDRLGKIGLAALDRFQETWNTADVATWSKSLHFPHMRPSAGNFGLSAKPEDYIRASQGLFERIRVAGWHRSQWNSRRVVHVARN